MIQANNVKTFELNFDKSGRAAYASLTQWSSETGWTVCFAEDGFRNTIEISDEMLDALLNLHVYATTYKEPAGE